MIVGKQASPIARGTIFAALAALSFGATAPIIAVAGRTVGPLATASLLYLGAALVSVVQRAVVPARGARLPRELLPRVVLVALFGAAIAPTLLAWGLQRTGGTIGSLLLNLEAVFTVLLARAIHREPIGRRVMVAMLAMLVAGAALVMDAGESSAWSLVGLSAVALAMLAWSLDNALTRPLAEHEPATVVVLKASLGTAMTGLAAIAMAEARRPCGARRCSWRAVRRGTGSACGSTSSLSGGSASPGQMAASDVATRIALKAKAITLKAIMRKMTPNIWSGADVCLVAVSAPRRPSFPWRRPSH